MIPVRLPNSDSFRVTLGMFGTWKSMVEAAGVELSPRINSFFINMMY